MAAYGTGVTAVSLVALFLFLLLGPLPDDGGTRVPSSSPAPSVSRDASSAASPSPKLVNSSTLLALYDDSRKLAYVRNARLDSVLRVSTLEVPPLEFTMAKLWGPSLSTVRREPRCDPTLSSRTIHLVIGVPSLIRVRDRVARTFVVEEYTDALERGYNVALGVVHRAAESELCGLCSVTVVRPSELTAVNDFDHDANMSSNVYETDPTLMHPLVDPKLCGGRTKRTMQYWRMKASTAGLADWHAGVLRATDKVVADEADTDAVVAFLDASFPPEAAFDQWLSRLTEHTAAGVPDHKSTVVACPHTQNWGNDLCGATTTERSVKWGNVGFEAAVDESTTNIRLIPRLTGVPRLQHPVKQPHATFAFASSCFATRTGTWAAAAGHRDLGGLLETATTRWQQPSEASSTGGGTPSPTSPSARLKQQVASMALQVSSLKGLMRSTERQREVLLNALDITTRAFRCTELLPFQSAAANGEADDALFEAQATANTFASNFRVCLEARAVRELLVDDLRKQVSVVVDFATQVIQESRAMSYFTKTARRHPIIEVVVRSPRMEVVKELAALPEGGTSCFFSEEDGKTHLCASTFRHDELLAHFGGDDPTAVEERFTLTSHENENAHAPFVEAASAFQSIVQVIDEQIRGGLIATECRACQKCVGVDPRLAEAFEVCHAARLNVINTIIGEGRRAVAGAMRFVDEVADAVRELLAMRQDTDAMRVWSGQLSAFLLAGAQPVMLPAAGTVERFAPDYVFNEPRLPYGMRSPRPARFQTEYALSHPFGTGGPKSNASLVFGALVASGYASRGVRLQWNVGCGCSQRTRHAHDTAAIAAKVIRTRLTMSPVCNCKADFTQWDVDRGFAFLLETYTPLHGLANLDAPWSTAPASSPADLQRPMADLGRPRVVEVVISDGDPSLAKRLPTSTRAGVDYRIVRMSCQYSRVRDLDAVEVKTGFDEVWVASQSCRAALMAHPDFHGPVHVVYDAVELTAATHVSRKGRRIVISGAHGGRWPDKYTRNTLLVAHFDFLLPGSDWRTLFEGYFGAFSAQDNVTLLVKTEISDLDRPSSVSAYDSEFIRDKVLALATTLGIRDHNASLPHFIIQAREYSEPEMVMLYDVADIFVSVLNRAAMFSPGLIDAIRRGTYSVASLCGTDAEYISTRNIGEIQTMSVPMPRKVSEGLGYAATTEWCESMSMDVSAALVAAVHMSPSQRKTLGNRASTQLHALSHRNARASIEARVLAIEREVRKRWLAGWIPNSTPY